MTVSLPRRALAELLGSAFLAATVVGSGIMAQRLSPDDTGSQLLENAFATGAVLVALILTFGTLSAAFNPVVTLVEAYAGAVRWREVPVLVAAQVAGCAGGVVLANLMFGDAALSWSTHHRATGGALLAEVVATTGLLLVIAGTARSQPTALPYAVGGFIAAAYWFTSSTSFVNPAITVGRMLSDSFAGIAPASAPAFIAMQLGGGVIGAALIGLLWPPRS